MVGATILSLITCCKRLSAFHWIKAEPSENSDFTLAGCTIVPSFDFTDFELTDEKELLHQFPVYAALVNRLCR